MADKANLPKETWGKPCFVAWTTTPWTLPSNVALCVGPKIEYVIVETYNPYDAEKLTLVMAASRVAAYLKSEVRLPMVANYQPMIVETSTFLIVS